MSDFVRKIDRLLGANVEAEAVRLAVQEASMQVFSDFGDAVTEHVAARYKIPSGGYAIGSDWLGGVVSEVGRAFQIDPSRKDHPRFAGGERGRPVYWVEGNTVYTQPDTVTCWALIMEVPTSLSDVEAKEQQLQTLIMLQAAQHILQAEMAQTSRSAVGIGALPAVPSPPSAPSFSYTDAAQISPAATSIGTLPSAPQLASLTYSVAQAPSVSDLDLSTQIDNTTSLAPPAPPSAPSISYTDAAKESPGATSVGTLPAPPTFNKDTLSRPSDITVGQLDLSTEIDNTTALSPPSKTLGFSIGATLPTYNGPSSLSLSYSDYTTYFGVEDTEMSTDALEKLRTEIQEFQANVEQALSDFQNQVQKYSAEVQKEAEAAGVDVQDFQTDLSAYQQKVERQVQEFQQNVQSKINRYTAEGNVEQAFDQLLIEQERARVQTALEDYNAQVEKIIQQAQIEAQEAQQTAQNAQEAELRNAAQQAQTKLENYSQELQQYQQALSEYSSRIERQVQEFQANFEKAVRLAELDQQADIQEQQLQLKDAQADLQADIEKFNADVQKEIQQAQITAQEAQQTAANAQEAELANAAKALERQIQEYQADLQQYEVDLQSVQVEMEQVFREAEIKVQQRQQKTKMQGFDMQRLRSRYKRQLKTYRKLNRSSSPYRIVHSGY